MNWKVSTEAERTDGQTNATPAASESDRMKLKFILGEKTERELKALFENAIEQQIAPHTRISNILSIILTKLQYK